MCLVLLLVYQLRTVRIVHVKLGLGLKHKLLLIQTHLLLFGVHLINPAMFGLSSNDRVQTLLGSRGLWMSKHHHVMRVAWVLVVEHQVILLG